MKKVILSVAACALLLASCGGAAEGAIDTTDNAAKTYCDLMTKAEAATGEEQEKLKTEVNDLENKIEKAHEGDDAWFEEFETKLESTCQGG